MGVLIRLSLLALLFMVALLEWSKPQPQGVKWEWPYPEDEDPDTLRDKLLQLRMDVDKYLSLPYQSPCSISSNVSDAYTTLLHRMLLEMLNYEIDGFRDNPDLVKNYRGVLEAEVEKVKKGVGTPAICALTKGMICSSNQKCECRDQYQAYNGDFQLNASYDAAKGSCFLNENSPCQAEWEPQCVYPTWCFARTDFNPPAMVDPGRKNPEVEMLCTHRNRHKYRLDNGGWLTSNSSSTGCFCTTPNFYRRENLIKAIESLQGKLTYKEECTKEGHELEEHFVRNVPVLLAKTRWSISEIHVYHRIMELVNIHNTNRPLLCQKKQRLTCEEEVAGSMRYLCGCDDPGHFIPDIKLYNATWDPVGMECRILEGDRCGWQESFPKCHEENGIRCLIDDLSGVLCLEENFKILARYESNWFVKRLIGCTCVNATRLNVKRRITSEKELMVIRDNVDMKKRKYVHEALERLNGSSLINIRELGENCTWRDDKLYFNAKDHVRARMDHVFYETQDYVEIKYREQSKQPLTVCDHEKQGLRCDFLQKTCQCPTDQYELEKIPSFYSTTRKRCELRSRSRCHPTLSEWLFCPEGESCVYKENKALCNRVNMRRIVESKNFLKKAKCICLSNDQVKPFSLKKENNLKKKSEL